MLFNACKRTGTVPAQWRSAVVKMLYKGNVRTNPEGAAEVTNYRGLSQSSCVGKLLEGVLHMRLEALFVAVSPLYECQNGFRRHRSATGIAELTAWLKFAFGAEPRGSSGGALSGLSALSTFWICIARMV